MGGPVGSNETRDSAVSRYLYGKIIQETCFSRYGADLATAGLVMKRFYSISPAKMRYSNRQPTSDRIVMSWEA